jgi:hypothetical protein
MMHWPLVTTYVSSYPKQQFQQLARGILDFDGLATVEDTLQQLLLSRAPTQRIRSELVYTMELQLRVITEPCFEFPGG